MLISSRGESVVLFVVLLLVCVSFSALTTAGGPRQRDPGGSDEFGTAGDERPEGITADWFDPDWGFRREITVSTQDPIQQNYQVVVTLTTSKMGSPYENVNSDGSDIRFTDTDGVTGLDHWIESWDDQGDSTIWVELDDAVNGSSSKTIYMYHGNPDASSSSDPSSTFHIYDDFSDGNVNGWTNQGGGDPYHDSGRLAWYSDGYPQVCYYSGAQMDRNQIVEAPIDPASAYVGQGFLIQDQSDNYISRGVGDYRLMRIQGGGQETLASGSTIAADQYLYETWFDGDTIYASIAGDTVTAADGTWSSGYVGLSSWWANSGTHYMDWIRVREYTSNEPTTSVSGEVEPTLTIDLPRAERGEVVVSWDGNTETVTDGLTFAIEEGTDVDLEAVPADLHSFSHWDGDHSGTDRETTITMDGNKFITAHFDQEPIEDWYDLDSVRGFLGSDVEFSLGADLDESSAGYEELVDTVEGWDPIGSSGDPFTGTFDGNGHTISDLYIDRDGSDIGLFGGSTGSVKDVGILNVDVRGNGTNVGGLVGVNLLNGVLERSYVTGSVRGSDRVGGLVGSNIGGHVTQSLSYADVEGSSSVGGLVGSSERFEDQENFGPVSSGSSGDIQTWTVPYNGTYALTAEGAQGGHPWSDLSGGNHGYAGHGGYGAGGESGSHDDYAGYGGGGGGYSGGGGGVWDGDNAQEGGGGGSFIHADVLLAGTSDGNWDFTGNEPHPVHTDGVFSLDQWNSGKGSVTVQALIASEVNDSYARGDVTGGSSVGGLIGDLRYSSVVNTYASGSVEGAEENTTGGLIGEELESEVRDSFWDLDSSGEGESAGGTGKTTAEMKDVVTFTDLATEGLEEPWDFVDDPNDDEGTEDVWDIDDFEVMNDGYPFLSWQEFMGMAVEAPGDQTESSSGNYTYTYGVNNTGNVADTYNLTISSSQPDWTVTAPAEVTVSGEGAEAVEVEVSIPVDAGGEGSEITLEATSQTDPDVTDSDSMTVTLEEDYQVLVTAPPDRTENSSGNYTYSYQVENTGNTEDTYELDAQADRTGWSASPRRSTVTVAVGEMETVEVEVSVPEDIGGESSEITLEASSQNDAATVDSDSMNVTLEERLEVLVEAPADQTEKGSGTHTYTYEVENTGNTEDTYELSAFAVRTGWSASSQRTSITVAPGEVEEVKVDVEIPEDVSDGDSSEVILTAESQSDPDVSDSDPMIVSYSLEEVRDVMVEAPPEAVEEEPGTYTYSFEVQNTGNVADTYDLSIETSDWEVEAPTEVSVDEGSAEEVDVDLTIPEDVSEGETVEVTLTAVSQENGSASDSDSMSVTFRQEMEEYELTIEAGEGGTTDPEPGTYGYSEGTEVVVEALPDEGWYFTGWTGDYEGGEKEIVLTMDSDKEVMADFEEVGEGERVLTIFVDGEGSTDPESGSHVYEEGEEATVEALPGEGWYFERWSGDHQSEEKTLTIEMTENYTITAEFAPQVYGLEIDSTEGGEVVEPGEGMFEYEHGASVSLQAVADEGYHFVRWSGDNATIDDVVAGQTGITIEGNCTLTAEFAESEVWIEIKNPVDGEVYDDTEVEIEWTSKGADYHEIKLNDSDWIHMENATSYRFEELEEGNYTITIRAVGLGGNIVEDTVEFRVDPQQGSSSSSGSLLSSWWFLLFIPLVIFLFLLLWIGVKKKGEEEEKEREIEGFPTFKKIERSVPVGKGSSRWTSEKTIDREKSGGEKGKVQKKIKRVKKEGEGGGSKKIVRKKKKVKEPKGEADIEKSRPVMGVSGEKEESEEEKKLCQNCGIMIPEKKKICPECGHVSKEGSDEEYEEIFSLDDEIFSECPECGFLITDEEDECPYCDASLKDEAEEKRREKEKRPPDPLSSSTSEPKRKCPECGEDISEDQEVCHRCGSLLEEEDKI